MTVRGGLRRSREGVLNFSERFRVSVLAPRLEVAVSLARCRPPAWRCVQPPRPYGLPVLLNWLVGSSDAPPSGGRPRCAGERRHIEQCCSHRSLCAHRSDGGSRVAPAQCGRRHLQAARRGGSGALLIWAGGLWADAASTLPGSPNTTAPTNNSQPVTTRPTTLRPITGDHKRLPWKRAMSAIAFGRKEQALGFRGA